MTRIQMLSFSDLLDPRSSADNYNYCLNPRIPRSSAAIFMRERYSCNCESGRVLLPGSEFAQVS